MSLLCLIHELSYEEIFAHKTRLIPSEDFALINELPVIDKLIALSPANHNDYLVLTEQFPGFE